jgi:hypothetical protein
VIAVSTGAAEPAPRVSVARAAQAGDVAASRYDEATALWLTARVEHDGTPVTEIRGHDFLVRKSFAPGGPLSIEVTTGRHSLAVRASRELVEIRSGKRRVRFNPTAATEADYHAAKELLARSRVLGRLHGAAAALGRQASDSPEGFGFLLTQALVALIDGDPSPAQRLKERMRARVVGLEVQPVRRAIGECYDSWRQEALRAMYDLERCVGDFSVWNVPMRNLCNLDYTLRVEAAWFEFLGCSLTRAVRLP